MRVTSIRKHPPDTPETSTLFTEVPPGRLHVKRWGVHVDPAFDAWFHAHYHGEEKYVIASLAWDAAILARAPVALAELDNLLRRDSIYQSVRDSEFAWWARTHGPSVLGEQP